jgi:hypothetical protein
MATFQEQIDAALTRGVYSLVRRETGKSKITPDDSSKVFTISKADIIQWIEENGIPEETCHKEPSLLDGIYLIESERKCELYYQERGCQFEEKEFSSKAESIEPLVDMILYHSGTNIK